jgi:hypothetical protein
VSADAFLSRINSDLDSLAVIRPESLQALLSSGPEPLPSGQPQSSSAAFSPLALFDALLTADQNTLEIAQRLLGVLYYACVNHEAEYGCTYSVCAISLAVEACKHLHEGMQGRGCIIHLLCRASWLSSPSSASASPSGACASHRQKARLPRHSRQLLQLPCGWVSYA